ncbi:RusA family crossover junction endodeoxyribonuclease [Citrobacter freundii]|uniref:RusA family crossover junction endodeoxyribonuclease n=1 Tax=Citrobacter freundii TaxID=546 RepID=UPI001907BBE7|nr:RusA family crossover junction endodeoxyribonuclease [Citrobacter freundii]MBJ9131176.1 RusA family crossover junction endodeoxyribonuclease [Citrobacter freundii]
MPEYKITPVGKPRMTRADKWKKRPEVLRYRAFCDEVRLQGIELSESGSHVTFILPMPASWSKKKRAEFNGKLHQQKPDVDNLTKSLLDALFEDDAHIWDARVSKLWGETGRIIIEELKA